MYIYIYTCLDMYRWRWLASLGNMIIYDILEILGYTSNMFEYTGNMIIYIYFYNITHAVMALYQF